MRNFVLQSKGNTMQINAVVPTSMSRYPAITKVTHTLLLSWEWLYLAINWSPEKSRLADYSRQIADSLLLFLTEDVLRIMMLTGQKYGKSGHLWADEGEVEYSSNVKWVMRTMGMNKRQCSHIRFCSSTYECIIMTGLIFVGSYCGTASGLHLYIIQQYHLVGEVVTW